MGSTWHGGGGGGGGSQLFTHTHKEEEEEEEEEERGEREENKVSRCLKQSNTKSSMVLTGAFQTLKHLFVSNRKLWPKRFVRPDCPGQTWTIL